MVKRRSIHVIIFFQTIFILSHIFCHSPLFITISEDSHSFLYSFVFSYSLHIHCADCRKMILEIFLSVYCDFRICCFNCIVEVRDCLILCLLTSFNRRDCIAPCIADTFVVSCYFRSINVLCLINQNWYNFSPP